MSKTSRVLTSMGVGVLAFIYSQAVFGQSVPRPMFEPYALELSVADFDEALEF